MQGKTPDRLRRKQMERRMTEAIALPGELQAFAGRICDVDSHEMMPAQIWRDTFGPEVGELADAVIRHSTPWEQDVNSHNVPNYAGDVLEVTGDLMSLKGPVAPGAVDVSRRIEVMDAMGVRRQLMYPTGLGGWSMTLLMSDKFDPKMLPSITEDRGGKAAKWLQTYNEWILTTARISDRVRPTPTLIGNTVEDLMREARRMLAAGIRAVMLPAALPPGGRSPAHPDLEPFWTMMEEAECTVTLHLGSEGKFFEPMACGRTRRCSKAIAASVSSAPIPGTPRPCTFRRRISSRPWCWAASSCGIRVCGSG